MLLIDKDIKSYARNSELIVYGYNDENVNSASYDLTVDKIITDKEEVERYELAPGESVFIRTFEKLSIPNNILGRIAEKNSRMRMGLQVSGPHYQPGHTTYAFLRVQNISSNIIVVKKGAKIAQIFFEELKSVPEKTYDKQEQSSFNDEVEYKGFGKYEDEYRRDIKKYESVKEELENKESRMYANILTIMGIFISMFSLIIINLNSISEKNMSLKYLCMINVSLCMVITVLMGLILIFLNKAKNSKFLTAYCIILAFLVILFFILYAII